MPMEHHAIAVLCNIPQPDRLVKARAGHRASIGTPGHGVDPLRMPRQCLEHTSASNVPELDRAIPTAARQLGAIGRKGQRVHPVRVAHERENVCGWLVFLHLPEPNTAITTATSEQLPIGTPGQRVYCPALTCQSLDRLARGDVPQLDDGIIPTGGKGVPIRGKDHTEDHVRVPPGPEQGPALHIPEFDGAIPTAGCQYAFIRAKGEGKGIVGVRLPGQVQALASFTPYSYLSSPATC